MKRRNFFSKIGKGLLGLSIVKALPTPEVETAPDTTLNLSLPNDLEPTGICSGDGTKLHIIDSNANEVYVLSENPDGILKTERTFDLPDGWEKDLPSNKRKS